MSDHFILWNFFLPKKKNVLLQVIADNSILEEGQKKSVYWVLWTLFSFTQKKGRD